jgi:hypothetical protein
MDNKTDYTNIAAVVADELLSAIHSSALDDLADSILKQ